MIDVEFDDDGMPYFNDTIVYKGTNLLTTQEGTLYYNQMFGIDLKRFIDPDVIIQTETFKAYSIQRMTDNGITVTNLQEQAETFESIFNYVISEEKIEGLVAQ